MNGMQVDLATLQRETDEILARAAEAAKGQ